MNYDIALYELNTTNCPTFDAMTASALWNYEKIYVDTHGTRNWVENNWYNFNITDSLLDYTNTYRKFDLAISFGYEYEISPFANFTTSFGIRGKTGLINIYSGNNIIPPSFNITRGGSIGLSFSVKYLFNF